MRLLLYMYVYRERKRMSARVTCTHQQGGDPREFLALPRASACGNAPNESRAHMGLRRVTWAGPGQVVIRQVGQVGWHAVCCCVLLCAAVYCSVLLCAAVCCCHRCLHSYPRLCSQHTPFQVRVHMSESQVRSLCVSTSYPCVCVHHIPVCVCVCLNHTPVCLNHMARRLEERLGTGKSERAAWHSARCVKCVCVYMYIYMCVYMYFVVVVVLFQSMIELGYATPIIYVCTERERERGREAHAHTSRVATPGKSWPSLGPVHVATLRTSHGHTRDRVESRVLDPGKE